MAYHAYVFPGFLTLVLTQLFLPKPPTTFLTCFCRGERRKYTREKSFLNRGSNSQPPGHESDTLTTKLARRGQTVSESELGNEIPGRNIWTERHIVKPVYPHYSVGEGYDNLLASVPVVWVPTLDS